MRRRTAGSYELDDDPARIDPVAAAAFLTTEAYWARWRAEPDIRRQIIGMQVHAPGGIDQRDEQLLAVSCVVLRAGVSCDECEARSPWPR